MKKTAIFLAAVLFAAAAEAAPTYQVTEMVMIGWPSIRADYFQRLVRPYRDRTERFSSARLDALQMSIAVGDPADELTLEGWGDNRADIRSGSSRVMLEYGVLSGDTFSAGSTKDGAYPGRRMGAYGRLGSFEVEASRLEQTMEPKPSGTEEDFSRTGAGAGFSFGFENVRLGGHGNVNKTEHSSSDQVYANNAVGGALAVNAGPFELGATVDWVDRGSEMVNNEETRSGPMLGAQAMIKPFGGLRAALRASVAKLSGDYTVSGSKYDFEGDNSELGARAEWAFQAVPLTVAASYDKLMMDPTYSSGGMSVKTETENTVKAVGAALRPFGGRVLLGAEIKSLDFGYDTSVNGAFMGRLEFESNTLTAGAEFWLLPGLALRASFQRLEMDMGVSETLYNCIGGGAGLKGENYTLDASLRRVEKDPDDDTSGDRFMEVRLMYGYRF